MTRLNTHTHTHTHTHPPQGESVDVYVGVYGSPFNLDGTGHAASDYKISGKEECIIFSLEESL